MQKNTKNHKKTRKNAQKSKKVRINLRAIRSALSGDNPRGIRGLRELDPGGIVRASAHFRVALKGNTRRGFVAY